MSPRNRVTATGWKLIGKAAELVDTPQAVDTVAPGDCVFAARFTLRAWLGRNDPLARVLEILGAAVAREWPQAPALAFDRNVMKPASRLDGLSW